jgi:hypothetical protein
MFTPFAKLQRLLCYISLMLLTAEGMEAAIFLSPHEFVVGGEIYHLKRSRDGGSSLSGELIGVHALYERWRKKSFLFFLEGSYSKGSLFGKTREGDSLKSHVSESDLDIALGYVFALKKAWCFSFGPFVGGGRFEEVNRFISPSPLTYCMFSHYYYGMGGLKAYYEASENFRIGFVIKIKHPIDPLCDISNDPDFDSFTLLVGDKTFGDVEVPIALVKSWPSCHLFLSCTPFYEFRKLGGMANYPFDFIKTTYHAWGTRLEFGARF